MRESRFTARGSRERGPEGGPARRAVLLDEIADEIRGHLPCASEPCATCTNLVPGEGSATADLVVVGEAPGASEDQAGRPFVGRAGRLLDEVLEQAGVRREDVFITNVLKARPPKNRDPRADEIAHHWPWLEAQLEVIGPRLVVPLGRHALEQFAEHAKISKLHGQLLEARGRALFPMYHPAAVLHVQRLRETVIADARALGETLAALLARAA